MAEILTADHGKEAGHWYRKDGTPAYEIIGGNGKSRPTTLRDARKENLVPSVTTIIACAARPGLMNWMIDQAILSALTCPRIDDEPEAAYLSRLKKDSKEQARKAAERGTLIHSWVQRGFEAEFDPRGDVKFYISAKRTLDAECSPMGWISEKSFATDRYGGKCDLHNDNYLLDIKSTDKDIATVKTWDEHSMQLSAYDEGLVNILIPSGIGTIIKPRKCGILYIHQDTAESRLIWIDPKELDRGWKMFNSLVDFWYAKSGLEAL
jgi:hypothetical protein